MIILRSSLVQRKDAHSNGQYFVEQHLFSHQNISFRTSLVLQQLHLQYFPLLLLSTAVHFLRRPIIIIIQFNAYMDHIVTFLHFTNLSIIIIMSRIILNTALLLQLPFQPLQTQFNEIYIFNVKILQLTFKLYYSIK